MSSKGYHFKLEQDGQFITATCIELEGCRTFGVNMEELQKNMTEVLTLWLEKPDGSNTTFPGPMDIEESDTVFTVYPEDAGTQYLNYTRLPALHVNDCDIGFVFDDVHYQSKEELFAALRALDGTDDPRTAGRKIYPAKYEPINAMVESLEDIFWEDAMDLLDSDIDFPDYLIQAHKNFVDAMERYKQEVKGFSIWADTKHRVDFSEAK